MATSFGRRTRGFTESVIRGMTPLARNTARSTWRRASPTFPRPTSSRRRRRGRSATTSTSTPSPGARSGCARRSPVSTPSGTASPSIPERDITVTCGATEAMVATCWPSSNPGDEVIVFEPFYENYGPDAILCRRQAGIRAARPGRRSTSTDSRPPSRRGRAPSSSTRRTTRPAVCSPAPSWSAIARPLPAPRRVPSPTRSTSTSATRATHVPIATLPGHARSGRSRSAARRRPSP